MDLNFNLENVSSEDIKTSKESAYFGYGNHVARINEFELWESKNGNLVVNVVLESEPTTLTKYADKAKYNGKVCFATFGSYFNTPGKAEQNKENFLKTLGKVKTLFKLSGKEDKFTEIYKSNKITNKDSITAIFNLFSKELTDFYYWNIGGKEYVGYDKETGNPIRRTSNFIPMFGFVASLDAFKENPEVIKFDETDKYLYKKLTKEEEEKLGIVTEDNSIDDSALDDLDIF